MSADYSLWLICHSLLCASASQREILFSCHVGGAVANRSVEDIFPAKARRGGEEPERRFISDWAVERGDGSAGSTKHLIYLLSSASRRLSGNPVFAARRGRGRQSFGLKTFFPRRRGEAEKNRKGDLYRIGRWKEGMDPQAAPNTSFTFSPLRPGLSAGKPVFAPTPGAVGNRSD